MSKTNNHIACSSPNSVTSAQLCIGTMLKMLAFNRSCQRTV